METGGSDGGPGEDPRSGWRERRVQIAISLVVVLFLAVRNLPDLLGDDDDAAAVDESSDDRVGETTSGSASPTTAPSTTAPTTAPPASPLPTTPKLPGLTNQGVIDGLAGPGWTCTEAGGISPDIVEHSCHDPVDGARLDMVATSAGEVIVVTVYGDEDGIDAFRDVASLGWTGVDGGEVAAWIESTVSTTTVVGAHDRQFGDVPFTLVGDPGSVDWALEIGHPLG